MSVSILQMEPYCFIIKKIFTSKKTDRPFRYRFSKRAQILCDTQKSSNILLQIKYFQNVRYVVHIVGHNNTFKRFEFLGYDNKSLQLLSNSFIEDFSIYIPWELSEDTEITRFVIRFITRFIRRLNNSFESSLEVNNFSVYNVSVGHFGTCTGKETEYCSYSESKSYALK